MEHCSGIVDKPQELYLVESEEWQSSSFMPFRNMFSFPCIDCMGVDPPYYLIPSEIEGRLLVITWLFQVAFYDSIISAS